MLLWGVCLYSILVYSSSSIYIIYIKYLSRYLELHTRVATAGKYNVLNIILFIGQLEGDSDLSNARLSNTLDYLLARLIVMIKCYRLMLSQLGGLNQYCSLNQHGSLTV
jgi:hypothetical protein